MPAAILLNYHAINDDRYPERCHRDPRFSLPRDRFVKQLRIIESEAQPVISLQQALDGASGVVLTFDDGHPADQLTTWPLLQEHGVKASFFPCLLNMGGAHDPRWGELRRMHAEGHAIGAHGITHNPFNRMLAKAQRLEMERSKTVIEERIGAAVDLFAFPSGKVTRFALSIAPELGFRALFTTAGPLQPTDGGCTLVHRWSIKTSTSDSRFRATLRNGAIERMRKACIGRLRKCWAGIPMGR